MEWKSYPQEKPTENEYYLTYHEYQGKNLIKAFVYKPETNEWLWDRGRIPQVLAWYDKPFKWYAECMVWGLDKGNLLTVPEEYRNNK